MLSGGDPIFVLKRGELSAAAPEEMEGMDNPTARRRGCGGWLCPTVCVLGRYRGQQAGDCGQRNCSAVVLLGMLPVQ